MRKAFRSKIFLSVRFYHAIALLKLVFGALGAVIYPPLQRRKALAPPCLVLPQSPVPGRSAPRGSIFRSQVGAFARHRASDATPLIAIVCTSFRPDSRAVSAANREAFWLYKPCHDSMAGSPYSPVLPNSPMDSQELENSTWNLGEMLIKGSDPWRSLTNTGAPALNRACSVGGISAA